MITPKRFILGLALAAAMLPAGAATVNYNFDDGALPPGCLVFGTGEGTPWTPLVESGGVGDTPCIKITKNVNGQWGSFIIPDQDGGVPVYGFRATFMARVGGGTAPPADGWSFCVAPDLPDAVFGEGGAGNGFRVGFDIYNNPDNAPCIRVMLGATVVQATPILPPGDLINDSFVPVEIKLDPDGSLDVTVNGKVHFNNLLFPGYQPLAGARMGFGARTGGLNANHWYDNIVIETYTSPQPAFVSNPQDTRVIVGSSATFNVTVNNGDQATIQWLRGGAPIPGATGPSYTLTGATLADAGAKISARATIGSTTVTSSEATLDVVAIDLPAAAVVSYDFNDGMVPAGAQVFGTGLGLGGLTWEPYVSAFGGVGDSAVLQITEDTTGQSGAFIVPDQHAGAPVYGVAARFDVLINYAFSTVPADGMSFNFAADLPDGVATGQAEEGVGSGLRVCFDIYDNTDGNPNNGGEAPAITLKWGETVVGETKTSLADITTGFEFADVIVRVTPDGLMDVAWNGKVLLYRAPVPGFGSIANGRFGFFARTGGSCANHWVDNLRLYTYLTAPLRISKQPVDQTVLVNKPATFSLEVNMPTGTTYKWFKNNVEIPGATSASYTTPATVIGDNGAKFKGEATLGAEVVTSAEVTLTVVDLTPPASPQLVYDFNSGTPAGAQLGGNTAFVDSFGGVGDSGVLKLTTSANDQSGTFLSPLIQEGAQLLEFTFAADILGGNGTSGDPPGSLPADGYSINIANDLPLTPPGDYEAGAGSGITITVDTYDNTDNNPYVEPNEAPSVDVRYKGQVVASKLFPVAFVNSGTFAQMLFRVKENGVMDLAFGDTVVFQDLQLPAFAPMSGLRISMYARTGGANASYWFDNVQLGYTIPATVSITSEPKDVLVLDGQPATFDVQVSNPQGVTYQWKRDNVNIPGATQPSYTTPALTLADQGAGYMVVVTAPGNTVNSRTAVVSMLAKFDAGASPAINVDFNDGLPPTDGSLWGTATILFGTGVDDTAFVQLTDILEGQNGSFLLNTPAGVTAINDFTATWMMRVGGGTATPADGCSFVFGSDIADGPFGEDGAGSFLVVQFDTFDNGDVEVAPEITIRYKTATVITLPVPPSVLNTDNGATPAFEQIGVRVSGTGVLDLYYGNHAIYKGIQLPNYTAFAPGRFGWGARTGGLWDYHWVDSIKIALNTMPVGPMIGFSRTGDNLTLTWAGGGTLERTSALPGGWQEVAGATTGYTVSTANPAEPMWFYRVRQ